MKAKIDAEGNLHIYAETHEEGFALRYITQDESLKSEKLWWHFDPEDCPEDKQ